MSEKSKVRLMRKDLLKLAIDGRDDARQAFGIDEPSSDYIVAEMREPILSLLKQRLGGRGLHEVILESDVPEFTGLLQNSLGGPINKIDVILETIADQALEILQEAESKDDSK